MDKRFERTLSQILSLIVLIVFVTTLITVNTNIWAVSYVWAVSFLIGWILMLIFSLHILFQSKSYGLSIFVAIITALAFGLLSIPAILVMARFIPKMPTGLRFYVDLLDNNNQLVLYTSLIAVYFAHTINAARLKNKNQEQEVYDNLELEEDEEEFIQEIDTYESDNIVEDSTSFLVFDGENSQGIDNNSIEIEKNSEKIVFESNIDEKLEYNTEKVVFVEDLTEEDKKYLEGEENNG